METRKSIAIIEAILAAALFGASAPLSKLLLGYIQPITLAGFLYLGSGIGAAIFLSTQILKRKENVAEAKLGRMDVLWLAGAILSGGVAAPIILLFGLKSTPASTTSLLLNFEAVATTLLAFFVFKEAVDKRILGAIGLITLGSIVLTWTEGHWGLSLGALGVLAACVLWGMDNNLTRHISGKNPLEIVAYKGCIAGIISISLGLLSGEKVNVSANLLIAMGVGAICYGMSIWLFILALRGLGSARTSALFGMGPFIGAVLSLFIFWELPSLTLLISALLMLAGIYLMIGETHQHQHTHQQEIHNHRHYHDDKHHDHDHVELIPLTKGAHAHLHIHDELKHYHDHSPDIHHRHIHQANNKK